METPFCRLARERRCLADCVEAMGLESKFNRYIERRHSEWQEMEEGKFHLAARCAFQEIASAELMSPAMMMAEITFLALSRVTDGRKQYKEVEEIFDTIWDGGLESVNLFVRRALGRYNVRFTERREKV